MQHGGSRLDNSMPTGAKSEHAFSSSVAVPLSLPAAIFNRGFSSRTRSRLRVHHTACILETDDYENTRHPACTHRYRQMGISQSATSGTLLGLEARQQYYCSNNGREMSLDQKASPDVVSHLEHLPVLDAFTRSMGLLPKRDPRPVLGKPAETLPAEARAISPFVNKQFSSSEFFRPLLARGQSNKICLTPTRNRLIGLH